ncbi:MAG: 2-isopropylmalate synthase [Spirochaetales bacterium]|nr:2-isopropylmalate synthase [Spirochaetales bacterium]
MESDRIIIFDTTLRDGEQSLAASLGVKEKIRIARALERLRVDVIEAGFPVSSPGEFESVKAIAGEIKESRICGLSRALRGDIEVCADALKPAGDFRIHTFISTSDVHIHEKLRKDWSDVLEMAVDAVKFARRFTDDVEFSCEDAGRTPLEHLFQIVEAAIKAGAATVNIPDTVGYTLPSEFGEIIRAVFNNVPNIDKAVISVHCHDDLGLSVANSISAVQQGAGQVECTINGLGERAGNCSLEEVVMILHTRSDILGKKTGLNIREISRTSRLVSQICNVPVQPNKAIVGSNAFAHSAGIHQDGVLKNRQTYEIMTPESIGLTENSFNLTSRSGRHVIKHRLELLGYEESEYDLDEIYNDFLSLADQKGRVYDYDLESLVIPGSMGEAASYHLSYLNVSSGAGTIASATVALGQDGETCREAATGNGPVEAVFNAIDRITGRTLKVEDYRITAKTVGRSALGQVDIVVAYNGRSFHGASISEDIMEASARAYINVVNNIETADMVESMRKTAAVQSHAYE